MVLSQGLQQKLLQRLSPQQIQLMKLLQVPTANLEERIKEEMEENPALEQGEEGHEDEFENKDEFSDTDEEFEKEIARHVKKWEAHEKSKVTTRSGRAIKKNKK